MDFLCQTNNKGSHSQQQLIGLVQTCWKISKTLRINMTKPLCKAVISDCCSSNRQGGGNHNRKGSETHFSWHSCVNRAKCEAAKRCCILSNKHSWVQWPVSPTVEWSHFKSYSPPVQTHVWHRVTGLQPSTEALSKHDLGKNNMKLTKTRGWVMLKESEHIQNINNTESLNKCIAKPRAFYSHRIRQQRLSEIKLVCNWIVF